MNINVNGDFANIGGNSVFHGPITTTGARSPSADGVEARAEVGVLTVIPQETRAVVSVLRTLRDFRERCLRQGPSAYEAWLPDRQGGRVRVAAVQTLQPGTEPAALAFRGLVEEYHPTTVLLVGVAGGVSPKLTIGDVVIADQVIAYDHRRETAEGPQRRGRTQTVTADLGHRLNDFFVTHQPTDSYAVLRGPIGTGNAVVTDANSEIRRWLSTFHEKVLAVETESAGVAESFHQLAHHDRTVRGWLTVRGISDTADAQKGHSFHDLAAANAADTMVKLLPYLHFPD